MRYSQLSNTHRKGTPVEPWPDNSRSLCATRSAHIFAPHTGEGRRTGRICRCAIPDREGPWIRGGRRCGRRYQLPKDAIRTTIHKTRTRAVRTYTGALSAPASTRSEVPRFVPRCGSTDPVAVRSIPGRAVRATPNLRQLRQHRRLRLRLRVP